jgi:hypothetical protein
MCEHEPISATLLITDLDKLDEKAYYELDELTRSIIHRFESEYIQEIEELISSGKFHFKGIETFILDEIEKMQAHIYSSYLMQILGMCINRRVQTKKAEELIMQFNLFYADEQSTNQKIMQYIDDVRSSIETLLIHPTIRIIVKKVNKDFAQIWKLFQVPLIDLLTK